MQDEDVVVVEVTIDNAETLLKAAVQKAAKPLTTNMTSANHLSTSEVR